MSTKLTSMKIQVDNNIIEQNKDGEEEEMEEGEASNSSESEIEVNVIVGKDDDISTMKYQEDEIVELKDKKLPKKSSLYNVFSPKKNSIGENLEDPNYYPYAQEQDFPTDKMGFDGRLDERVKRFGVVQSSSAAMRIPKEELTNLYKSLDIDESDFHRGGCRADAVHVRGVANLLSEDIFDYFDSFSPYNIERLTENSCNVTFRSKEGAAKALIGLSCPVINKKSSPVSTKETKAVKPISKSQTKVPVAVKKNTTVPLKKAAKNAKNNVDAKNTSTDESSSSESDDESSTSSSSDSDSSSGSSSSSDSSDSSSDSSSSSSSDSEVEETDGCLPPPPPVSSTKKDEKLLKEDPKMQVDDEVEKLPGSISSSDIGLPMPTTGKWRLGVPCPNTKALFLRFAHCKDKKVPGMDKPVDFYAESRFVKSAEAPWAQDTTRPKREFREARRRIKKEVLVERDDLSRRLGAAPPSQKSYTDLDDPVGDDTKNPWGYLSQNWNKKATQDHLDYQSLLRQHITGKPLKREREMDSEPEYLTMNSRPKFKRENYRTISSDEEDQPIIEESEPDDWKAKIRLPRMRMYADTEEKRTKKLRPKEVRMRIGHRETEYLNPRRRQIQMRGTNQFDLRSKLLQRNPRRRTSGSDGE